MKFDELDKKMRVFETAHDLELPMKDEYNPFVRALIG